MLPPFPPPDAAETLGQVGHSGCLSFSGSLSGEFICHRRRPHTVAPEGEIRHTALTLSAAICFTSRYISVAPVCCSPCSSTFPPSLSPQPSLSLSSVSFSLPPPSRYLSVCAPLSQDCEQVTVVEEGRSARISRARRRWASVSVRQGR